MKWLEKELANSDSRWKIAFFHHPLYSSGGRHGSEVDLRTQLEPLFMKHGVNVVFPGHEHFYERLKPQKGIYYFTAGGSAKLRAGNIQKTGMTDFGFDSDYTFMLDRDCRRRHAFPDAVALGQACGLRFAAASGSRHHPVAMNRSRPGSESTRSRATRLALTPIALGVAMLAAACAPAVRSTAQAPLTAAQIAELWIEPEDVAARDLFHGPGGRDGRADPMPPIR